MNSVLYRLLPVVMIGAVAPCATAAEWAIESAVETRANVTDNLNLAPGVHDNVFSWLVAPRVNFSRKTEAAEVAGAASLGLNRYPGNSDLNTDDAGLSLTSQLRTERTAYGLSASYVRDSTLESELAATGIVQTRSQRNLVSISPTWSYSLTERSSLFAQYQYQQAVYEAGVGLTDYSYQQASAGYQYVLSARTTVTLSENYSLYAADDGSVTTSSYGFNIGLTHSQTENLSLSFGIGSRRSDTTMTTSALLCEFGPIAICQLFGIPLQPVTVTSETADDGLTFNAAADYKWERASANLSLSRDINPSGTGQVVQSDRLAFGLSYQFNEKLSANVGGAYILSHYLSGVGSDTDYYRLDSGLSWKLDERWTAGAGYYFAYQKVRGAPDSANANTVFLSIGYNWPRISASR